MATERIPSDDQIREALAAYDVAEPLIQAAFVLAACARAFVEGGIGCELQACDPLNAIQIHVCDDDECDVAFLSVGCARRQ